MKHYLKLFTGVLVLLALEVYTQQPGTAYIVRFANKNNSPYSLNNPSQFVSQAGLARRTKQNIPIDFSDLPVTPSYLQAIRQAGAQVAAVSRWFNLATVWINNATVVQSIAAMPFVLSITSMDSKSNNKLGHFANKKFHFDEQNAIPIPYQNEPKSIASDYYNYGNAFNQINMISGQSLHNQGFRGEGMVIAVLDAGFRNVNTIPLFDSLRLENRILGTRDFVQPGNNVYNPSIHPHGTNVLSIMAANWSGQMVGTAPKANYWLLRTEDAPTEYLMEEYFWVAGAEFADSVGAWVINSSLGYTTFDNPLQNHTYMQMNGNSTPVTRGADKAASKGILVVNSAGNSGTDPSWLYIGAPADGDSVLAIGAVDGAGNYVAFSSKGPSADGRVKPDVCARGSGTAISNSSGVVVAGNGTSFSSPIIAGMAACLWQSNREKTNMQVAQSIKQSCSRFNNPDSLLGYGIPNFNIANLILKVDEKPNETNSLAIFPNPFSEFLWIGNTSGRNSLMKISFTDASGKTLLERDITSHCAYFKIEQLSHLRAGLYLIRITTDKGVESRKLLKM